MADDTDVIRALFKAFADRDVDGALEFSHEEIEFWPKVIMTLMDREQPYVGHAGIREYFDDIAKIFDSVAIEVQSVRSVAGGAAVFGVSRGTPIGGQAMEIPLMLVVRLEDGRVVYARSVATAAEAEAR